MEIPTPSHSPLAPVPSSPEWPVAEPSAARRRIPRPAESGTPAGGQDARNANGPGALRRPGPSCRVERRGGQRAAAWAGAAGRRDGPLS